MQFKKFVKESEEVNEIFDLIDPSSLSLMGGALAGIMAMGLKFIDKLRFGSRETQSMQKNWKLLVSCIKQYGINSIQTRNNVKDTIQAYPAMKGMVLNYVDELQKTM